MHPTHQRILLIDDDENVLEATAEWLELSGYQVEQHASARGALRNVHAEFDGILVSDIRMPDLDGMQVLQRIQHIDSQIPVILITGHAEVPLAVRAMQQGAWDFLEKPFDPERLEDSCRRALEQRRLQLENRQLREQLNQASQGDELAARLLGQAPMVARLRDQLRTLAATRAPVLIQGETGTGKEVIARGLHAISPRSENPFVAINCGAIAQDLIESELFGHCKGAFTGATESRTGKLEYASGGTLFLDEIESMPLEAQVKLLRVLQEQELVPLGSNRPRAVELTVVAATKVDLRELANAGQFREDLYYRLAVAELHIPPLRERKGDIPLLVRYFCEQAALVHGVEMPEIEPDWLACLQDHNWPGNLRELRNRATRYVLGLEDSGHSDTDGAVGDIRECSGLNEQVAAFERNLIQQALQRHRGQMQAVLDELRIPRRTLNEKMKRHDLKRPTRAEADGAERQ